MARKLPTSKKSDLGFTSEEEAKRVLLAEAKRLQHIAIRVWRRYLGSYQPKKYMRTMKSQTGIKIGVMKKLGENEWGIEVTYENDLMYHDSVVKSKSKTHPKGHAVMLISSGWKSTKLESKIGIRPHFTRYQGFNYLGEVVKAYNAQKHKGVTLEVQWSGKYTKK